MSIFKLPIRDASNDITFNAPSFYNQADQDIYNQGFSFIPQEQFRGGAFKIPGDGSVENDTFRQPIGILLDQGGGGGNNAFNASDNPAFLGNYGDIDFNERYKFNPQEFMTDANDFGFGVADEDKGFLPSLKNKLGKGIDFGKMIGGGILSAATGIPFLGAGLNALSKNFEKRELGAGVIDEYGNFYDEDELNRQNACCAKFCACVNPCCCSCASKFALFLKLPVSNSPNATPSLPPPKAPAVTAWSLIFCLPIAACLSKSCSVVSITCC